MKLLFW